VCAVSHQTAPREWFPDQPSPIPDPRTSPRFFRTVNLDPFFDTLYLIPFFDSANLIPFFRTANRIPLCYSGSANLIPFE
jgi:hypothetical protein